MRRVACVLGVLGVVMLALCGVASAVPSVQLEAAFVPIPGFSNTGNISGAAALVQTEYRITGTEYLGAPPPITHINFYLPSGTQLHTSGFPTCAKTTLEQLGPVGCPTRSLAGSVGKADGFVHLGGETVEETYELRPYHAPDGGIEFFIKGSSPVTIEQVASGQFINAGGDYGPELETEMPLVASVPGAPYMSFGSIDMRVGSPYGSPGEAAYEVPTHCQSGGLPFKAEVTFAENGEQSKPLTVTTIYRAPCPTESVEASVPETPIPGTGGVVSAPSDNVCLSRRDFTIHVHQLEGVTYRRASVYVNGRRVAVAKGARISAPVDLRGLPKGLYTVKITVITTTGRRITGARSYHTCAPKPLPGHHHLL